MRYHLVTIMIAGALLSSCASMDKSQCLTADWRTIGFEDGSKGKAESSIGSYRQDCAEHGVAPDLTRYRQGHREGSEQFCTRRNGFVVGKRGSAYQNSCASDLESEFLTGFGDGKSLYDAQKAVSYASSALDKQQRLLSQLEKDISAKTALLVEDGLVKDERLTILADIEALKVELVDAAYQLPLLEGQVQQAQKHLLRTEQRLAHYQ